MTMLVKRKTTIPTPSYLTYESAGGATTLLVVRSTTSKPPPAPFAGARLVCTVGRGWLL